MSPIPAGLAIGIPAMAGLAGGVINNLMQRGAAREQMGFQERMSGTSYQRAVSDMRMAGINPMLAYAQGGASTPSGAQPDLQDMISPAVSSAMHARRLGVELQQMRQSMDIAAKQSNADLLLKDAERNVKIQDAAGRFIENQGTSGIRQRLLEQQIEWLRQQGNRAGVQNELTRLESELRSLELPGARNTAAVADSRFGRGTAWVQRLMQTLMPAVQAGTQMFPPTRNFRSITWSRRR